MAGIVVAIPYDALRSLAADVVDKTLHTSSGHVVYVDFDHARFRKRELHVRLWVERVGIDGVETKCVYNRLGIGRGRRIGRRRDIEG